MKKLVMAVVGALVLGAGAFVGYQVMDSEPVMAAPACVPSVSADADGEYAAPTFQDVNDLKWSRTDFGSRLYVVIKYRGHGFFLSADVQYIAENAKPYAANMYIKPTSSGFLRSWGDEFTNLQDAIDAICTRLAVTHDDVEKMDAWIAKYDAANHVHEATTNRNCVPSIATPTPVSTPVTPPRTPVPTPQPRVTVTPVPTALPPNPLCNQGVDTPNGGLSNLQNCPEE